MFSILYTFNILKLQHCNILMLSIHYTFNILELSILQDPYAAGAASALGGEVYSPELSPYNIQQEAAVAGEGRK